MYRKNTKTFWGWDGYAHKLLLVMKLTIFLIVAAFFQTRAAGYAQQLTYKNKQATFRQIIKEIRRQAGLNVLISSSNIDVIPGQDVDFKNTPVKEVLNQFLRDQPLIFEIDEKTILIKQKPAPPKITADPPEPPVIFHGRIIDSAGHPLAGVTVALMRKGAVQGVAITDTKGEFSIAAQKGDQLSVSYVGFETRLLTLGGDTDLSISLKHKDSQMESAVVTVNTGYQKIRPEQSTGAISQISTKEYESQISTDFLSGLVNKLPGLMINNNVLFTSTDPNGNVNSNSLFNIRGISTMSANQQPLIVIDGYPTELSLDAIDPNEIKTVTVLKDAAAATIYGVRASNGVIVIERKQAAAGRPKFSFRATSGITPKENYSRYRYDPNAQTVATNYERDNYGNSVNNTTWGQLITTGYLSNLAFPSVYYILAQQAAKIITPDQAAASYAALESYNNAKDYSRLFLRSALTQTENLDISGGNENALYYITANYTANRLEQIKNNNDKLLLTGRSTLKFSKRLSLELTTEYNELHNNAAPVPPFGAIYPYEHFLDENGNPLPITYGSGTNPYYNNTLMGMGLEDNLSYPLVDVNQISDKTHTVNNTITANFQYLIGHGFDMTFGGIYQTSRSELQHYSSEQSSEARQYINSYVTQNTDGSLMFNIPKGGFLRQETDNTSTYTVRAQLNYNKQLGRGHSINAIVGSEVRDVTEKSNTASYFGYNDQTLLQQPVDYTDIFNGSIVGAFVTPLSISNYAYFFNQAYTDDRNISGYSNLVYSYKNIYSLTGSARIDQSNLFGTNPKYKYKPLWSVGAAWNINKEKFMQDLTWIDMLKLRIATGFNGNVAKLSLPQVIAQSVLNTYTATSSPALTKFSYANSSLRWEQTRHINIGLDYLLFKHISGSIDYYTKKSTDLQGNVQIDPTIGVSPSLINNASINNKGLEIDLHADWITTKKLNWNSGFILARNTSKVLSVYQNVAFNPYVVNSLGYVQGYPVGGLFAYRYAGLDTAGFPLVRDTKGTLYHTDNNNSTYANNVTALMSSDTSGLIRFMGSSIPTINAGLSNRVDIGDFYFYCMLSYYGGFKVIVPRPDPSQLRPLKGAGNYWKQKGDENTTDVMGLDGYVLPNSYNAYNYADKYVVNGDYISLDDITVSYSLDHTAFIKRAGFSHFEVKLQAEKIWTVGLNKYNYSAATGSFQKPYMTPTYTIGIFTNF